jgi:hypothetical protein
MQSENWQRENPPCKAAWGKDGYIVGSRYRRETTAWHITTARAGTIHDYWVAGGRFRHILETRCTFTPFSKIVVTDDAEAIPEPDERTAALTAISKWEDAFDSKTPVKP